MMRSSRHEIPRYSLYGEKSPTSSEPVALHVEDIPSRSQKYQWQIATHRHSDSCQCVFVTQGSATVSLEDTQGDFEGPIVIIVPAGAVHGFKFRADTQGYVLTINPNRLLATASAIYAEPIAALFSAARVIDLHADLQLASRAVRLVENLLDAFRQPDSLIEPVSGWLACALLWMFATGCGTGSMSHSPRRNDLDRVRRFRLLVESHYLKHWPVERYARRLAISESTLNRLNRQLTGHTAFDVIQQRLALEARRRLVHVAGPIAAVAADLGFKDPAYFCRFFRTHNGMSPAEFRRRRIA